MPRGANSPVVAGALGPYRRKRVMQIAASLGGDIRPVHEDDSSMLTLDREPHRWRGPKERGLGWIEGGSWRDGASDWRQAGQLGACGIVTSGRRRFVHSSVNGLAPVYWAEADGAIYFASRIDALAQALPGPLSVDWDAWAAIFALRYPLGEHTPFAEIRRLGPFSTLRRRFGRARRESPTWPWAEVETSTGLDDAADALVAGLDDALAPLGEGVICPLSGGRDSRMLFCALARDDRVSAALTVNDDEGGRFEEELAAPVAEAFGVRHEQIEADPEDYPADWEERARRVEYQFVDHAWLVPLARRLKDIETPVPDGFAIDTLLQAGTHFYTPDTRNPSRPRQASLALFDSLRRYGLAHRALAEPFHEPLVQRAREQFVSAAGPFEGHPWQAVLSLYATRTIRGVSNYPVGLLGAGAQVFTPGASDSVAKAALSVTPAEKDGDALYAAIFERLAPAAGRLPTSKDASRSEPRLVRRWRAAPALEAYRHLLANGPLAAHISPELRAWLDAPDEVELPGDLRLGMEAVSLFHAWWNRYRNRLREVDARELLG